MAYNIAYFGIGEAQGRHCFEFRTTLPAPTIRAGSARWRRARTACQWPSVPVSVGSMP